jgi:levanase
VSPRAQTAGVDITGLSNGSYEFVGVLANSRGETSTDTLTVVVEHAAPATPKLSHDNRDKDGSFTVTADLWWGTNATSYRFLQNGAVVAEGALASATPAAQRASYAVTGMPVGRYEYVVEFRNAAGETASTPVTVTVAK